MINVLSYIFFTLFCVSSLCLVLLQNSIFALLFLILSFSLASIFLVCFDSKELETSLSNFYKVVPSIFITTIGVCGVIMSLIALLEHLVFIKNLYIRFLISFLILFFIIFTFLLFVHSKRTKTFLLNFSKVAPNVFISITGICGVVVSLAAFLEHLVLIENLSIRFLILVLVAFTFLLFFHSKRIKTFLANYYIKLLEEILRLDKVLDPSFINFSMTFGVVIATIVFPIFTEFSVLKGFIILQLAGMVSLSFWVFFVLLIRSRRAFVHFLMENASEGALVVLIGLKDPFNLTKSMSKSSAF